MYVSKGWLEQVLMPVGRMDRKGVVENKEAES